MAVGCEPGAMGSSGCFNRIQRTTLPALRSSSATREEFHKLHQALRPSRVDITVYGNEDGIRSLLLTSKRWRTLPLAESRSTTLSERLLATRSLSLPPAEISAKPAGYEIAVPAAVFCKPNATFFPAASVCGSIGMNRSGVTLPSIKL